MSTTEVGAPSDRRPALRRTPPARAVAAVAGVDFRRLTRDRTALFFVVVLPVVVIIIIGVTFGANAEVTIGVVDQDGSELSAALVADLDASDALAVQWFDSLDALNAEVRRSGVVAGVVIPPGYGRALRSASPAELRFVEGLAGGDSFAARTPVLAAASAQGATVQAARFAAAQTGEAYERALDTAEQLARSGPAVGVAVEPVGRAVEDVSRFSYTAPTNLVLFVFLNSLTAATAFAEMRRLGMTRRMLAAPLAGGDVVAGITLNRFAFALLQSLLIVAVGAFLFGVRWGDPLAAGALVVVFALVSTGAGMLLGTFVRSPDQAGALGPPIGIALGMLGGCMWTLEIVSPTMRAIGHLTPHAWAVDAWLELVFYGGHLADIVRELAVLGGFAVALLGLAVVRVGRQLA
ncbi:MAG: ABC transporter permease [Acidimicrobiales bacterium]|nr:ABC transporter permease [Acidimicrobiales bacterium]